MFLQFNRCLSADELSLNVRKCLSPLYLSLFQQDSSLVMGTQAGRASHSLCSLQQLADDTHVPPFELRVCIITQVIAE